MQSKHKYMAFTFAGRFQSVWSGEIINVHVGQDCIAINILHIKNVSIFLGFVWLH